MRNILRSGAMIFLAWMFFGGIGFGWLAEAQGQTTGRSKAISNVRTDPASPRTGDKIKLLFDPSENVVRAEIKWTVNGTQIQASDYDAVHQNLELNYPIKSGDVIVASILPYEAGGIQGQAVEHRFVVGNAPPILSVVNQNITDKGLYTAKIEAKNPQGGAITLKLEQAPTGLTMDPNGNIEWNMGRGTTGKFSVRVVGEDQDGQKTFLTYEIGVRWQK
jgi:hypothetical protein